jgi:uncharacterized protein YndB with AHSA1/START domain
MKRQASLITVETGMNASVEKVWKTWTNPDDIIKWNSTSPEWHTPRAEHDLKPGGKFIFRMEAKDGSYGFDFGGVYDVIDTNKYTEYTLGDGRKVKNTFIGKGNETQVVATFEAETENSIEMQRGG